MLIYETLRPFFYYFLFSLDCNRNKTVFDGAAPNKSTRVGMAAAII